MGDLFNSIKKGACILRQIGKGVSHLPDYEAYVEHLKTHHPDVTPPSKKEFFKNHLNDKYGASATRC